MDESDDSEPTPGAKQNTADEPGAKNKEDNSSSDDTFHTLGSSSNQSSDREILKRIESDSCASEVNPAGSADKKKQSTPMLKGTPKGNVKIVTVKEITATPILPTPQKTKRRKSAITANKLLEKAVNNAKKQKVISDDDLDDRSIEPYNKRTNGVDGASKQKVISDEDSDDSSIEPSRKRNGSAVYTQHDVLARRSDSASRENDVSHDDSEDDISIEQWRKRNAVTPQKLKKQRKSSIAANKLLKKVQPSDDDSDEEDDKANNALKKYQRRETLEESVQHTDTTVPRRKTVTPGLKRTSRQGVDGTSKRKVISDDDSDDSSVEPSKKRNAITVSAKKSNKQQRSVPGTHKLLGKVNDNIKLNVECHPCYVLLSRYPVHAKASSVYLDPLTLNSLSVPMTQKQGRGRPPKVQVHTAQKRGRGRPPKMQVHTAQKRGRGRPPKMQGKGSSVKKQADEDWKTSEGSISSKTTSASSSNQSHSTEGSTHSSSLDVSYEPSEGISDREDLKSVSSYSSGSDLDYEPSDEDSEDIRFSRKVRHQAKLKLRPQSTSRGSWKTTRRVGSSDSSLVSSLSFSLGKSTSSTSSVSFTERVKSDSSLASSLSFSLGTSTKSSVSFTESAKSDTPTSPQETDRLSQSFRLSDVTQQMNKDTSTSRKRRGRPRKSISSSDVERQSKPEPDKLSSNSSDMENMNSDISVTQRGRGRPRKARSSSSSMQQQDKGSVKRRGRPRKSRGTSDGTPTAHDDAALCSAYGIYPCTVVCRKVAYHGLKQSFMRT